MLEMHCFQIDSETLDLRRHCDHTHARQMTHIVLWKNGSSSDRLSPEVVSLGAIIIIYLPISIIVLEYQYCR